MSLCESFSIQELRRDASSPRSNVYGPIGKLASVILRVVVRGIIGETLVKGHLNNLTRILPW